MRGRRRAERYPLQIYGGLADGWALGAVIKPSIWLWGRLISQPDPQSETTASLETGSHVGGRLKPPKSQRLRAEGECLNTLKAIISLSYNLNLIASLHFGLMTTVLILKLSLAG